ncbi:MAG: alkaline phosphatase family protein [Anaerohalosphaera sp.]|nr:alkaline phosphatase family protein [Anaerohalosphaera sp.]
MIARREFLKNSLLGICWFAGNSYGLPGQSKKPGSRPKVIVVGFDGMDPVLAEKMMDAGQLPNLDKLRKAGGYSRLGTSNPPQSPVAWANFINGAGPGTHGIFDFIHRDPAKQCQPFYSAAETEAGDGYLEFDTHKIQLDFWPFNHTPTQTFLRRHGVPFWEYLDRAGIPSAFFDLPANYPPSSSSHGHHCCLSGMGTPDMLGTYGTYQHYSEDGPVRTKDEPGGKRSMLFFENETAPAKLVGPVNDFLIKPEPVTVDFEVHRDIAADASLIEIQDHRVLLKKGQWSDWLKIEFELSMPALMPNNNISGICRFYLQEVAPNFRLYVTPINIDPSKPAVTISEPDSFVTEISSSLGLFYTTGFQEDHKALSNRVFSDSEFAEQAEIVLQERIGLLNYAMDNYEDGLLFFYFSSTDLQSHMFYWDTDEKHPSREPSQTAKYFEHVKDIYRKADSIVGDVIKRYGSEATVMVMSDHGFGNFKRQFNVNTWLRDNGYIQPSNCDSIMSDKIDWSATKAYSLGLNGLYINLKGRERDGVVEKDERERLMEELITKLKQVTDVDGKKVIRDVYRTDKVYSGPYVKNAPDLLVGYYRGYRAAWTSILGDIDDDVLSDNKSLWAADHCIDPHEVPGVLFTNRHVLKDDPALIDIAPTILNEFGLETPGTMTGKNIFKD